MTVWLISILVLLLLAALAIAGFAGHRLAYRHMRKTVRASKTRAAELTAMWQRNETVAGAYSLSESLQTLDRPAAMLPGVEKCYYAPPDFDRVTWVPRDVPTPFVGFAPAPGRLASAVINNAQFRYDRELDVPKAQDVYRIFFTGASTAFGCGATSNETTIGGYLETYLNSALRDRSVRCEVVTAAACAWSSTHERILIENRLVELEPDLVISFSGHNDAFWAMAGCNSLWFRAFQDDYFLALTNATLASNLAPEFPSKALGAGGPVSLAQAGERLARNIAWAHHALATVGAAYMFALQPTMQVSRKVRTPREQRVAESAASTPWFTQMEQFNQEFRRRLSAIENAGFHFVDTTSVFDGCGDEVDIFIDSCHFGDRGNDLIARSLCGHVLRIIPNYHNGYMSG